MTKSLWEIHQEWVAELLRRGEKVLQPKGEPHESVWGYIKTQIPHRDAGSIYKNEDGTFEILCDMCQYGVAGLKLEDIGLCDSKCWYEWMDKDKYTTEGLKCYRSDLKKVKIEDLIGELLSREKVRSFTISQGKKFNLMHVINRDPSLGPADIIIIDKLNRTDGYK